MKNSISVAILVIIGTFAVGLEASNNSTGVITPTPTRCIQYEFGQFIQLEMTSCTTPPCSMVVGRTYEIGVAFVPGFTFPEISYDVVLHLTPSGSLQLASVPMRKEFIAGITYKETVEIFIQPGWEGSTGQLYVNLWSDSSAPHDHVSRCFLAMITN